MPVYIFKHPHEDRYVEIVQRMADEHSFIDDSGLNWERVWTVPNASLDSIIKPDSSAQFVNKTKGWSVGECWDYSAELSQARKDKRGEDHLDREHKQKKSKERRQKQSLQRKIEMNGAKPSKSK